ncbi:MAG: hypothetical protein KatS3mg014_2669 [Actinomycetota bacterium]|nr:MAG: hypothetical protein KatS3mg014_2669 [Actinomycetota bacterium]
MGSTFYATKSLLQQNVWLYSFTVKRITSVGPALQLLAKTGVVHIAEDAMDSDGTLFDYATTRYLVPPPAPIRTAWEKMRGVLRFLRSEVERQGGRLVLLYIPPPEEVDPSCWREVVTRGVRSTAPMDSGLPERTLRAIAVEEGIAFFSLLPVFRAASHEPIYFETDNHWTALGQALAAEAFAPWRAERMKCFHEPRDCAVLLTPHPFRYALCCTIARGGRAVVPSRALGFAGARSGTTAMEGGEIDGERPRWSPWGSTS